jgi:hypothetical protein
VAGLDEEKIKERIKIKQPSDESDQPGAISRQFRFFYKEIKIGHLVFARKGRRKIIGLGVVTDEPYFDDKKAGQSNIRGYSHPNFLPVRWLKDFKPIEHKKLRLRTVEPFEDQKILDALENYLKLDAESSDNSAISVCDSPPIGTLSPDRAATSVVSRKRLSVFGVWPEWNRLMPSRRTVWALYCSTVNTFRWKQSGPAHSRRFPGGSLCPSIPETSVPPDWSRTRWLG